MKSKFLLLGLIVLFSCNNRENSLETLTPKNSIKSMLSSKKSIKGENQGYNQFDGDNCQKNRGNCAWAIVSEETLKENTLPETSQWDVKYYVEDDKLYIINSENEHPDVNTILPILEKTTLPSELSNKLGYNNIEILPGEYKYQTKLGEEKYNDGFLVLDIVKK